MARRRSPHPAELLDMGPEPDWDDQHDLEQPELKARISRALNWYNYNYNSKDYKKFYIEYLNSDKKLKKHVPAISTLEPWEIKPAIGSLAKMATNGFEFGMYKEKFDSFLEICVEAGNKNLSVKKAKNVTKAKAPVVSIQERVRAVAAGHIGNIEHQVDEFIESGCKKTKFSLYGWLQKSGVKGGHMKPIIAYYKTCYDEMQKVLAAKEEDEQLVEGYSYLTKPKRKKLASFYGSLISEAEEWQENCRGNRKIRKRKIKKPKDLVKALKYKKKDEDFGIESVNPVDVIGASQVWVFDTKTRFMHKYSSDIGIAVKGSTLKEFDSEQSFKKKIREAYCEKVLDDVANGGKIKLRKALDSIKAKEVPVTGRIGKEMVIVRVMK